MAVSLQSDLEILNFWESHGKEAGDVILLDDILSLVKPDEYANTEYQPTSVLLPSELSSMSASHRLVADGEDDMPGTATTPVHNVMKKIDPSKYPYNSVGAILVCVQENSETYDFICSAFIIDDNTLMTAAHVLCLDDSNAIFVPAMINGTKPFDLEKARYGYFAVQTETKRNHPDHKPYEDVTKKQILQVVKSKLPKSKWKTVDSSAAHLGHLNPSVDICTVKVGKGRRFDAELSKFKDIEDFKEAGLNPIPVESLDPTSDESYPCKIVGYCCSPEATHNGQSITMHTIEGKGYVDGGNLQLFMNKLSQHGMSGGPWIKDSNAVGLQSSVLNNRSSYSPLFTKETLSAVGVDSS